MKKRTPARLQAEYEIDAKKFEARGVALDADGKYLFYILYENHPDGAMAYFFDKNCKAVRLHTSTYYRLLDERKAVQVAPDEFRK